MPRAAAANASQAYNQSAANANNLFGQLEPQAQSLINSKGYDPATLGAITNAGMGSVNSAFGNAGSQIARNTARTKNQASDAAQQDVLAQQKGVAAGNEAGNIQIQNADFANQQKTEGLNLLSGMYGANLGTEVPAVNAQTNASPGWAQTLTGIMGSLNGSGTAAAINKCWVAAELYGGWFAPETVAIRQWLSTTWYMAPFWKLYGLVGRHWADFIRVNTKARAATKYLFDMFLRRANG